MSLLTAALFASTIMFCILWLLEEQECKYWRSEMERYRDMWDRTTWNRDHPQQPAERGEEG